MKNPNPKIRTCMHDSFAMSVLRASATSSDPALWDFTVRCRECGSRFVGYLANIDLPDQPTANVVFRACGVNLRIRTIPTREEE